VKEKILLVCLQVREDQKEQTNVFITCAGSAKRLSTAFDSVTLYGNDPHTRPDIYGKIGNAGVSICCLDDAKKLYSGFDLVHALTSVSMTNTSTYVIRLFMNAAIDQQCEYYIKENSLEKKLP
jgi:methylmalonyl-CoA mutase